MTCYISSQGQCRKEELHGGNKIRKTVHGNGNTSYSVMGFERKTATVGTIHKEGAVQHTDPVCDVVCGICGKQVIVFDAMLWWTFVIGA
jgi:hypothetical protein